ncbi:MAG TPA: hypothetical protein DD381_07945 [Lentisphaeria bacterium]|nr:MAG: hypothetical protein A2X47_04510 [Lentisphaerae bacterium GWF2_38_69]HBM16253.1 hypothetical protein [Lentisphaeria bacterium]
MKNWKPQQLIEILIDSAKIALRYYGKPKKEIKKDLSIVTVADKTIEAKLALLFDKPDDHIYMIGEETILQKDKSYLEDALKHTAWIVDPIDGTVPYANGLAYWGISIGYAKRGVIKEGAIYFPITHDMYITDKGKVYTAKINPLSNSMPEIKNFSVMKKPDMRLNNYDIVVLTQSFAKHGIIDIPNPVIVLCCATASFAFTAAGKFMSYIGSSIKVWDYAAAFAILKNLNFMMTFIDRRQMSPEIKLNHELKEDGSLNLTVRKKVIVGADEEIINYILKAAKQFV